MAEFKSFDTTDEMLEWLAEQKAKVQARSLSPRQEGIKYGDHAVRFMEGLTIFVYVEPLANEDPYVIEEYARKDREENMLFCKCYSTVVPNGEYGFLHRSVLWPISLDVFEDAAKWMWTPNMMEEPFRFRVEQAFHHIRAVQGG